MFFKVFAHKIYICARYLKCMAVDEKSPGIGKKNSLRSQGVCGMARGGRLAACVGSTHQGI